jgi:signal recognition particle GTPase
MANGVVIKDEDKDFGIASIYDFVLSLAKDFGYGEYVDYDKHLGHHGNRLMDEEPSTQALIERYDDEIFWEELEDHFADRDFARTITPELWEVLSPQERRERRWELEIQWGKELEQHGIDRLEIRDRDSHNRVK